MTEAPVFHNGNALYDKEMEKEKCLEHQLKKTKRISKKCCSTNNHGACKWMSETIQEQNEQNHSFKYIKTIYNKTPFRYRSPQNQLASSIFLLGLRFLHPLNQQRDIQFG